MAKPYEQLSIDHLRDLFLTIDFSLLIPAVTFVLLGFIIARIISIIVVKTIAAHASKHVSMIVRRITFYIVFSIFLLSALDQLQVELTTILGAAGIFTVTIGFASRPVISNLISGLFLIGERPFEIGDDLEIGNTTGEIISIDLLSIKLKTSDNVYIRVPNDQLMQDKFTNTTRFPIRRFDLFLYIHFEEDVNKVKKILWQVAKDNPLALDSPKPHIYFMGISETAVQVKFCVWVRKERYLDFKSELVEEVKTAFNQNDIKFAVPSQRIAVSLPTKAPLETELKRS